MWGGSSDVLAQAFDLEVNYKLHVMNKLILNI